MKTGANARPTNRKVKQALERKEQILELLNRRLEKITDSDNLTSREKVKRKDRLIKEYTDMLDPIIDIEMEEMNRRIDRKVGKEMSDEGGMFGRPSNSTNRTAGELANRAELLKGLSFADSPGKGSDEPITYKGGAAAQKRGVNKNKGGLIRTGAKDYRKGGMFY